MSNCNYLHGVVCYFIGKNRTVKDTIIKLLELSKSSEHYGVECHDLYLRNKYYQTTIQLLDHEDIKSIKNSNNNFESKIQSSCHAIIIYADGSVLTTDQLDKAVQELEWVGGEPRILICDGIDETCPSYKTFIDWSIKNSFDFMVASQDGLRSQVMDSLSAYKWPHRSDKGEDSENGPQLNDDTLKKLADFDNLLSKINAINDNIELRGDPSAKKEKIEEIGQLLSDLIGEDCDQFSDIEY